MVHFRQRILIRKAVSIFVVILAVSGMGLLYHFRRYPGSVKLIDWTRIILGDKPQGRNILVLDWTGFEIMGNRFYQEDNCVVTSDRSLLSQSHAVVITHRLQNSLRDFPQTRHLWQRWVWLLDENPFHALSGQDYTISSLDRAFNWTMTYRKTSDVHIPYGWTTRREKPEPIPNSIGNRTKATVAVISNCWYQHNDRYNYIRRLQKFTSVDLYGKCWGKECGEYFRGLPFSFCNEVRDYLFFLAFENSNCKEYITEKAFSHGFEMGAVPVVMGAPKEDYIAVTPPNSFIYAGDFAGPAELGRYLTFLSKNKSEYLKYHEWRKLYITSYRLQYSTLKPVWSSLCQALRNDDGQTKIYDNLGLFWTTEDCLPTSIPH